MIIQKSELDAIVQAVVEWHKGHRVPGYDKKRSMGLLHDANGKIEALDFDNPYIGFGLFDLIIGCICVTDDCTSDDIAQVLEVLGWTVEL